jgi:hypothetical protein
LSFILDEKLDAEHFISGMIYKLNIVYDFGLKCVVKLTYVIVKHPMWWYLNSFTSRCGVKFTHEIGKIQCDDTQTPSWLNTKYNQFPIHDIPPMKHEFRCIHLICTETFKHIDIANVKNICRTPTPLHIYKRSELRIKIYFHLTWTSYFNKKVFFKQDAI